MVSRSQEVIVWKATWLPGTETFVRHQMNAMERWKPCPLGLKRIESPVSSEDDRVLFGPGLGGKVRRRVHSLSPGLPWYARQLTEGGLVHAHFLPDATLIAPSVRRAGGKLVITVHGSDVTSINGLRSSTRRRALRVLRDADRIIAVSDFLAAHIVNLGADPKRVRRLYTGIPVGKSFGARPEPSKWDAAFVGRLIQKKGLDDAIHALESAGRTLERPLRLAVVGSGPLEEELRDYARRSLIAVDWMGHLGPEQVKKVLSSSALLLAPSKKTHDGGQEGLGTVYLEAADAGVPAIGYKVGGVPEAVLHGETGLLADAGNLQELSGNVVRLLGDPDLRAQMGDRARARVRAEFDIARQTRVLESIYDEVSES